MTKSTKDAVIPSKTTLRELAARCGVGHSTLSKAVHERRLTAGVRVDDRGRVVVVDAAAAAAEWRAIHVPEVPELIRRQRVAAEASAYALPPHQDHTDERSWNARDILAFVLVEVALAGESAGAFVKRTNARLREAVTRSYADEVTAGDASELLLEIVSNAVEAKS